MWKTKYPSVLPSLDMRKHDDHTKNLTEIEMRSLVGSLKAKDFSRPGLGENLQTNSEKKVN